MNIIASTFKFLFTYRFFRKHYYGIQKHIIKAYGLFRGKTVVCKYDKDMKIKVNLDEWIQQQVYFLGLWDEPGSNFLKKNLKRGDVFIDIGANIGCYTLIASKLVGEEGRVIAFEPIKEVFEKLIFNVELNKLSNVDLNRKAVYSETAVLEFFLASSENMGMSSIFHHDTENGKTEKVEAVSLDDYFSAYGLKRADIIKIDVEGSEIFALRGMKRVLKDYRPLVIMEISDEVIKSSGIPADELLRFMREFGYIPKGIDREGNTVSWGLKQGHTNYVFFHE